MNKEIYTLKNGLKVVLCQDLSKHCSIFEIIVNFGGINKEVIIENKEYKIKDGVAHFIEHLLIENSIYGNSIYEFEKNYTYSNGSTSSKITNFYINSVYNFEEDLVKLINIVNNPKFTKDDIETTKHAIIKELMMSNDNKFKDFEKEKYNCLFDNIKFPNTLGNIDDIKSFDYDYIKFIYDAIYQANNQTIIVSGNFDSKKVIKLIEDTYDKIKKKNIAFSYPLKKEKDSVIKKEAIIKKDIHQEYVEIDYKIDINHLNNYEKVKLTYYLNYFLSDLFSPTSTLYHQLVGKKIIETNINCYYEIINNYLIIGIGCYTNNSLELIESILNKIKTFNLNKEHFELKKKKSIIDIILREDSLSSIVDPFIDNIIEFNYDEIDKIEDIENHNFIDYQNIIKNLNFNNYCILKMVKK